MNTRLQLLLGTLAILVALPWAGPLSSSDLERQIQRQMNSGAGPQVTREVACIRKNREGNAVRFACALHAADAPPLRVRVDVKGSEWRAYWPPVEG